MLEFKLKKKKVIIVSLIPLIVSNLIMVSLMIINVYPINFLLTKASLPYYFLTMMIVLWIILYLNNLPVLLRVDDNNLYFSSVIETYDLKKESKIKGLKFLFLFKTSKGLKSVSRDDISNVKVIQDSLNQYLWITTRYSTVLKLDLSYFDKNDQKSIRDLLEL